GGVGSRDQSENGEVSYPASDSATARRWPASCRAGQDEVRAMATILEFSPKRAAGSAARQQSRSGSETAGCQIVIFPGIRVERDDFDLVSHLPGPANNGGSHHRTGGK